MRFLLFPSRVNTESSGRRDLCKKYYEQVGLRFDYDRVLEFAKSTLGLPDVSAYATLEKQAYIKNLF